MVLARSIVVPGLRDLFSRPGMSTIRFEAGQLPRMRAITRGLLAIQIGYAVVGITTHGPGSLARDPQVSAALGWAFLTASIAAWIAVGRIRAPRRLEALGLAAAAVSMCVALISEVANPQAGYAVAVYQAVAVVFTAVSMPWRARSHYGLVALTAATAFAGIALSPSSSDSAASLAGAMLFAFIVAAFAAGVTCRGRSDRWLSDSRVRTLNAALRDLSRLDPTTGLPNRQALETHLAALGIRGTGVLAFAMVDIDHFKGVNDRYGHLVGDDVLRTIAQLIRGEMRAGDRVYRFGGEEFLIVLDETTQGAITELAERVRAAIEARKLLNAGYGDGFVTLSIGTAELTAPVDPSAVARAIQTADARLYVAKHAGRNRVVTADGHDRSAAACAPSDQTRRRVRRRLGSTAPP
ncbi:MAG: GGDEF domain-containing protein [Chloroflexota bacterium]|nr:MAG: GGDEF domain-containing protein [Chloroflexota bacterium]